MNQENVRGLASAMRGYPLRVFLLCLAGWFLTNMDQSFFGYAVPSIMQEYGVGLPVIGQILSVAFVFAAIMVVFIGMLADRLGRRIMFVACLSTSALLAGLMGLVESLTLLALLRCLSFALSSGLVPIANSLVVEATPDRYRGVVGGLLQVGYPMGWFVASLLAAPLIANFGWRYMFLPALAVVPIAFLLGWLLPESRRFEAQRSEGRPAQPMRTLFGPALRSRTIYGWLSFFLFGGAYAGTAFYFPTFFQQERGYSPEDATLVVGVSYGIGLAGYLGASLVGEYLTTRRNTVILWTSTGSLAVLGVIWNQQGFLANLAWFGVTAMFFYGTAAVLTTYVTEIFPTTIRATAVAVVAGVGLNLGFAVYPLVVAFLVEDWGWKLAFSAAIVPSLAGVGLVMLALPNLRSGTALDSDTPGGT